MGILSLIFKEGCLTGSRIAHHHQHSHLLVNRFSLRDNFSKGYFVVQKGCYVETDNNHLLSVRVKKLGQGSLGPLDTYTYILISTFPKENNHLVVILQALEVNYC